MRATLLGCGTSAGVPRVGNVWGKCDPQNPRNLRTRVSLHVEHGNIGLLIDTSPDLRQQCLREDIGLVTHVVWTHDHADHCHGIDDLRGFYFGNRAQIQGFARSYTVDNLQRRFGYVFSGDGGYPPIVHLRELNSTVVVENDLTLSGVDQPHGAVFSTGITIEASSRKIVYATDFSDISREMIMAYSNADLLFVDCLRFQPHPTHAHFDMALDLVQRCNVKEAVLIHMDNSLDYEDLRQNILAHGISDIVQVGYDGLKRELL